MGHESIAKAIEQNLLNHNFETKFVKEEFAEVSLQYQPIYQFFPKLNKSYYKMGKNKLVQKVMKRLYEDKKRRKLERIIRNYSPDVIISTYFFYNYMLGELKKKQDFAFINIIANPATTHPLEYSPDADLNLIYDERSRKDALKYGIPKEKVEEIGWFTKEEFFQEKSATKEEIPTILISAGSLGTSQVAKFLPVLFKFQKNFHYIFVAGKNKALYEIFKRYQNLCSITHKNLPKITILQFTTEMPNLMARADIIAGKAGPNLLFESVAAEKPFLALTYIPGQEDGNLDIIKEKNLGWVALKRKDLAKILASFTKNPELINEKAEDIAREKERISQSGEKLVKCINDLLNRGSRG